MIDFPNKYNFKDTEKILQEYWANNHIYKYIESEERENIFVIDTPPPTVSGMLHMGHVFSYTQADFIARYQRMKGKTIFYPMGFDDNGLPTERLVEKVKKVKGAKLKRSDFVALCNEVAETAREEFRQLFKTIALSVDWSNEYHTISDNTRKISQLSFLDLAEKNLLERKNEPTYWCPTDQTALAQADLEDKEMSSHMNDISFALENSTETITIATTRPELIPACVAIFVHPDDERYKSLHGKNALTALFKVKVPILTDEHVAQDKGTGIVMCCSFGDMTDVMWWKTHKLASRIILNKYGKIKEFDDELVKSLEQKCDLANFKTLYKEISGLKADQARNKILEILSNENLLIKQEAIKHPVKCAERSGNPIEIMLAPQWFIKILSKKEELLKQAAKVNWHPKHMKIRVDQWIEGLCYDWCISRQRFFGVPFPVWYERPLDDNNTDNINIIIAKKEELPLDPLFQIPNEYKLIEQKSDGEFIVEKNGTKFHLSAETDVMDTWATSSISPQISSQAINDDFAIDKQRHKKLFPADLRPQAHEIIRSWAFYTIVKAYYHENQVPWHNIMISGWCLAKDKTKMSKSKGNVVTPQNLIEEKGTDIVRYWSATSNLGADTAYSEDVLAVGKKLTNKLWNAAKFAAIHLTNLKTNNLDEALDNNIITQTSDLWILQKLSDTIKKADQEFAKYEYAKALSYIDNFFWKDFCDNYLELSKTRAYGDKENIYSYVNDITDEQIELGKASVAHTIYHLLDNILKLYAPFIPHITDELYKIIFPKEHQEIISIHNRGTWPNLDITIPTDISSEMDQILNIIDYVRKDKSDHNMSLKKDIESIIIKDPNGELAKINQDALNDLIFVCNIKKITFSKEQKEEFIINY
ncbi:MAG: valine--tRNA ligase [Alphaproteobacteria bacterium]|jgi:valyl-tRNA synthetase|nr:valine--tRNA ligase [Alphaproteobacteria bacterium]